MENTNKKFSEALDVDKLRKNDSFYNPSSLYLMMMGVLAGNGFNEKEPSRKHNFQQFLFNLIQKCANADEAKEVIADMQAAVTGTEKLIDSMEW